MNERANEQAAETEEATAGGNGAVETPTPAQLEEQLAAEKARAAEYLENWQRSHAEFVNYRRRTESERADMAAFANAAFIMKLLPVIDDFDLAIANVPEEQQSSPWVEGVSAIRRKLQKLLESENIAPIEAQGQPFDPNVHEAVAVDDDAGEPHYVVQELRKGYRLRDRVLRPTLVRVGSAPTSAE